MTIQTEHFKELLLNEQKMLETELSSIGQKNLANSADWDATTPADEVDLADEGEVADNLEKLDNNNAEVENLEKQLGDVKNALAKIENGTYGICEIGQEEIGEERLEANPSARTCRLHMN